MGDPAQPARSSAGTTICAGPFTGTSRAVKRSWEGTEWPAR